jgi:hypothetical protein
VVVHQNGVDQNHVDRNHCRFKIMLWTEQKMNPEELGEQTEHAHHTGQKAIGLTTAVTAVLLAVATLLGHRAHTEEIKLQTKVNDQWSFYQAKHQRAHDYGKDAEIESAAGNHDLAIEFLKISLDEECGFPVEGNCQAPRVKQSPILQKLMAELKTPSGNSGASEKGPAEQAGEAKSGDATKNGAAGAHEKPAKEGAVREGAVKIQDRAREMEQETEVITRRADHYDSAELFLEVSIVLCSIALLAENKLYWKLSFVSTVLGIARETHCLLLR